MAAHPTTVDDVLAATGISYRQFDYWCQKGFVTDRHARSRPGSGFRRLLTRAEIAHLHTMAQLVVAGLAPAAAAAISRQINDDGVAILGRFRLSRVDA
jgi:hypothetical protein